jgi:hypothetical protein
VKAEIAEPDLDRPEDGFLGASRTTNNLINIFDNNICGHSSKPGSSGSLFPEIQAGTAFGGGASVVGPIERSSCDVYAGLFIWQLVISNNCAMYRSNVLPTKSLCIHPGKSVWVLYVDATCINCDGNVFDATLLAMVAALKSSEQNLFVDFSEVTIQFLALG